MTSVAVIVPVLDDLEELDRLLRSLQTLRPGPAEVIVVDGSTSRSAQTITAAHGARYLSTQAGRGHQLHQGACLAQSAVLWFLHADAEIAGDAITQIDAAVAHGAVGGWFHFAFRGPTALRKLLLAALINARCRFGGLPYGDQGLFVHSVAYKAVGGFPAWPLFEEVPLVRALRRHGRFSGLSTSIGVSPRRWERDGWWRRTLLNRALALGHALGVSPQRLASWYRGAITSRDR